MKKWVFGIVAVVIVVMTLTSCNTLRGAREDVRWGAEGVSSIFR